MNEQQLADTYTALSEAIDRVGEQRATLFLATLSLALLARQPEADAALPLIAQAERLART